MSNIAIAKAIHNERPAHTRSEGIHQEARLTTGWHNPRVMLIPVVLFMLAFGARLDLFLTGSLYSQSAVLASDAILAALGFWMATAIAARLLKSSSWDARLVAVGAAIGIPAALIGLVELVAPVTPATATSPACDGASVAGAPFLATTPPGGVNARSGPDTTYPQVQRFAGNCTLAFDGYCVGEPTDDLVTKEYPDQRWLILHRPWQSWPWDHMSWGNPAYTFIAAGKVQSQSPENALGTNPAKVCSRLGGWEPPRHVALAATIAKGVASIQANAAGAEIIGLSIMSSQQPTIGTDAIFPLTNPAPKRTDAAGAITATWNAETVTGPAIGRPATLTLLASVCLGPAVADPGNYAIWQVIWNGKMIAQAATAPHSVTQAEAQRLQTTACRIAPDYPKSSP